MSGAIHPLPQYAFMAWCLVKSTGTTLPLPYCYVILEFIYSLIKEIIAGFHLVIWNQNILGSEDTKLQNS
jgi:hypothetical protein